MIRLRVLEADRFKQLRAVNLEFPSQGSFLVEGLNEAGKSTLFEAIFFGIFGRGLVTDSGLADLIAYDADEAEVRVALEVGSRLLDIRRTVRRQAQNRWVLTVADASGDERIIGNAAVNARVVAELGLDADAMLNSCFVEQKKLDKLESLSAADRERALMRLLNLERLHSIERELQPTPSERRDLEALERRVELAELRARAADLLGRKSAVEQRLAAARVATALARLDELQVKLAAEESAREQLIASRRSLEDRIQRIAQLDAAVAAAERLPDEAERARALDAEARDAQAEADRLEELRAQLPSLRANVAEIDRLAHRFERLAALQAQADRCAADLRDAQRTAAEVDAAHLAIAAASAELARAQNALDEAKGAAAAAEGAHRQALNAASGLDRLLTRLQRVEALRAAADRRASVLAEAQKREARARQLAEAAEAAQARARDAREKVSALTAARGALRALVRAEEAAAALRNWVEALRTMERAQELARRASDSMLRAAQSEHDAQNAGRSARKLYTLAVFTGLLCVGGSVAAWFMYSALPGATAAGSIATPKVVRLWPAMIAASGVLLAACGAFAFAARRRASLRDRLRMEAATETGQADAAAAERSALMATRLERARERYRETTDESDLLVAIERDALVEMGIVVPATLEEAQSALASALLTVESRRRACEALNSALPQDALAMNGHSAVAALQALDLEAAAAQNELEHREAAAREAAELAAQVAQDAPPEAICVAAAKAQRAADLVAYWGALSLRWAMDAGVQLDDVGRPAPLRLLAAVRDACHAAALRAEDARASLVQAETDLARAADAVEERKADVAEAQRRLEQLNPDDVAARMALLHRRLAKIGALLERRTVEAMARLPEGVTPAPAGLPLAEVRRALGFAQAELSRAEEMAAKAEPALQRARERRSSADAAAEEIAAIVSAIRTAIPDLPGESGGCDIEELVSATHRAVERERRELSADAVESDRTAIEQELGAASARAEAVRTEVDAIARTVREGLLAAGCSPESAARVQLTREAVSALLPDLLSPLPDEATLAAERERLAAEALLAQQAACDMEERLGLAGTELDMAEERAALSAIEYSLRLRERAAVMARCARESTVTKVLPNTVRNMRRILPALTMDRYHDAEIGDDYRIRVWDERAGDWRAKAIFSGGAKDQFSLALRLAFALATLPQERGAAPSFIFLDEPLGSFDAQRAEALTYLLTQGDIASSFDQIFVISHNASSIRPLFNYHLRLVDGRVEHDLSQ